MARAANVAGNRTWKALVVTPGDECAERLGKDEFCSLCVLEGFDERRAGEPVDSAS
jgi:hypothetical protein